MKVPAKDREVIEGMGAVILAVEQRRDQKGVLAYIVDYGGTTYRWAISSLQRRVPPWKYTRKTSSKYIYGDRKFIYRMFNNEGELLYVGKTTQLDYRLYAHFYKNPEKWKAEVSKIDVCEFANEADMHIYEMYLITKYNPTYNRHASCTDIPSIELPELTFVEISGWK